MLLTPIAIQWKKVEIVDCTSSIVMKHIQGERHGSYHKTCQQVYPLLTRQMLGEIKKSKSNYMLLTRNMSKKSKRRLKTKEKATEHQVNTQTKGEQTR